MNVPIVGIAYTPKIKSLLKQIAQRTRVLELQDLDTEKLFTNKILLNRFFDEI